MLRRISLLAAALLWAAPAAGATLFDPALRFRTLATEHFIIYFHQGEERLAPRLAVIAEEAWRAVPGRLGVRAPSRTHVILADQTEASNGWAFPLPYNTIMVTAAWPGGSEFIGHTDDWLRLVFVHEFTHIVHLDQSAGWSQLVRRAFGRVPLALPNLFLPQWQVEGLATYVESGVTGAGRLHAGDFRQVEREAARQRRLAPLDRLNGGLTAWPNGLGPYAYGLGFHAYLAERFGADAIARLTRATAGRVPYTASLAFRDVFGRSLGDLWRDYQTRLATPPPPEVSPAPTRLTHHGFITVGPRFAPPACAGCAPAIVYSARSAHHFPVLRSIALDGSGARDLTTRFGGSTTGVSGTLVVFDQQELHRNVGLYSDLFALDRVTGQLQPITSGARVLEPDLSPDGSTIVAVQEHAGTRALVLVASGFSRTWPDVRTLLTEPDTQFNTPRWAPDGRSIAAERRRLGGPSELVIVDATTAAVRVVASAGPTRFVTPAWRPDGRTIVAAVSPEGEPFNLWEFPVTAGTAGGPRQLTFATGGATWPDVSPDGRTLVYAGYTADGFDLFTVPYLSAATDRSSDLALSVDFSDAARAGQAAPREPAPQSQSATSRPYSPWATLMPSGWTPIVETSNSQLRAGAAVTGHDVLGYHAYAASATWLINSPSGSDRVAAGVPDWTLAYVYDRWQPTLFLSASTATSFFAGPPSAAGEPSDLAVRERELNAGVLLPFRRVRRTQTALFSVLRSSDSYTDALTGPTVTRGALRVGASSRSAQMFGYSISPEHGYHAGATAEFVRRGLGSRDAATVVTADVRAYLPGAATHHVVALRASGGRSEGPVDMGRAFLLGSAAASSDVLSFARDGLGLLRAFRSNAFAGTRIVSLNADYRWPLARPERGAGTWPLFLHTVHAALFVDAGHAWTERFQWRAAKTSTGGELSFDLLVGYVLPITVTVGAGWGHDGARPERGGAAAYLRVGRAF